MRDEYLFVVVALIFGLILTFTNPPFQSNDEDRHFYKAYMVAEGVLYGDNNNGTNGFWIPTSILNVANAYQAINFNEGKKIKESSINGYSEIKLNVEDRVFYAHTGQDLNPVGFMPGALGIIIGKFFNSNPMYLLWFARIGGLLFYIVIVFFAIRIIPIHKVLLMALALSPMSVYISVSVGYDITTLSLAYLFVAMVIKFAIQDGKITDKELLLLLLIMFFHRFAKNNYWLLAFLVLIIPPKKFKNIFYYIGLVLFAIVLIKLPDYLWKAMILPPEVKSSARLQTDFTLSGSMNISYYINKPLETAKHLVVNLFMQGRDWIYGSLGRFGYAYYVPSGMLLTIHSLFILTIALFDNNKSYYLPSLARYITLGLGVIFAVSIIGGYFIIGSPVGAHVIFGLQGRYFTPILILFLIPIYNNYYNNEIFDKYKVLLVGFYSIIILSLNVYFINNYFYAQ